MKQRSYFTQTAVALGISMAFTANAATVIDTSKQHYSSIQQQFTIGASEHSLASKPNALKVLSARKDANQTNHVRMQQMYYGFPVMGGYAISHTQKIKPGFSAPVITMNGDVITGLETDLAKPSKALLANKDTALLAAKEKYKGEVISEEKSSVIVYMDETNKPHWAYRVSFVVTHKDKIPSRPTSIIKADDMTVVQYWNDMKTAKEEVKGFGYGGNERAGKFQYGEELAALEITRDTEEKTCFLENKMVKIVDMDGGYSSNNKAMSFVCADADSDNPGAYWVTKNTNDKGYDEVNGAYSPLNDAMYAGYVIKHMYQDWYGLEVLTNSDGSPMQLVMRVHYGSSYENAFWNGSNMTFGDGRNYFYPLVSLGVGAHEISHGFTEQNSNMQYYGQSGGMNESFSDMAAQAAEHYSTGEASWLIGERIVKLSAHIGLALRYMETPSDDGMSIDTADDYYNGLDVHYSSGVYNRLFFLMANLPGWDAKKAFDVMVKANQDYWTAYTNYKKGACGVISATEDLGYKLKGVKKSLDTVKIDYSACS